MNVKNIRTKTPIDRCSFIHTLIQRGGRARPRRYTPSLIWCITLKLANSTSLHIKPVLKRLLRTKINHAEFCFKTVRAAHWWSSGLPVIPLATPPPSNLLFTSALWTLDIHNVVICCSPLAESKSRWNTPLNEGRGRLAKCPRGFGGSMVSGSWRMTKQKGPNWKMTCYKTRFYFSLACLKTMLSVRQTCKNNRYECQKTRGKNQTLFYVVRHAFR